ncbi:MAG: tetratricopeptide repeat protein [Deinococcaceae bacterium]
MSENTQMAFERARTLIRLDRPRDAIPILYSGLSQEPGNVDLLYLLALAFEHLGEYREALGYIEQALSHQPETSGLHYLRGNILLQLDRDSEALDAAELSLTYDPESTQAHSVKIIALIRLKRIREARETAKNLCQLIPDQAVPHALMARTLYPQLPKQTEQAARRALDIDPENIAALVFLSLSLVKQRRYREGLKHLESAIQLDLQDELVQFSLDEVSKAYRRIPWWIVGVCVVGLLHPVWLLAGLFYAWDHLQFKRAFPESMRQYAKWKK